MNLTELGIKHETDKASLHRYTETYDKLFSDKRKKKGVLLEIGIGRLGSLRMWSEYFPRWMIYGFDIKRPRYLSMLLVDLLNHRSDVYSRFHFNGNVKIYRGDQGKEDDLVNLMKKIRSSFDIIIDDGSHDPDHQILGFSTLYRFIRSGGFYIIEDVVPGSKVYEYLQSKDIDFISTGSYIERSLIIPIKQGVP